MVEYDFGMLPTIISRRLSGMSSSSDVFLVQACSNSLFDLVVLSGCMYLNKGGHASKRDYFRIGQHSQPRVHDAVVSPSSDKSPRRCDVSNSTSQIQRSESFISASASRCSLLHLTTDP